jgi:glycosyltransferase involved in cell wall biosynthesis
VLLQAAATRVRCYRQRKPDRPARQGSHRRPRATSRSSDAPRCHKNQPMIMLEAFACGVPVVATELGGLPEVIRPGENGVPVPPEDPDALGAALAGMLVDRIARS